MGGMGNPHYPTSKTTSDLSSLLKSTLRQCSCFSPSLTFLCLVCLSVCLTFANFFFLVVSIKARKLSHSAATTILCR